MDNGGVRASNVITSLSTTVTAPDRLVWPLMCACELPILCDKLFYTPYLKS